MSSEVAVIALAAGIYLFDCVVLLERGQAIWSQGALSFGSSQYQLRGKAVALLNPLTPFFPAFRTLPLFASDSKVKLSKAVKSLAPVAVLSVLQFVLVIVILPYCLYRAPGWPFFIALVLAYVCAIAMSGVIWWRFRRAGFATRPLLGLGFAWLVCLPLSVNALRKAGLSFDIALDAPGAIRFLRPGMRRVARDELAAQVAEALHEVDEGDERHRRLADLRRELIPETGHGRV